MKLLAALLPCVLCLPATADQFYLTARMDCQPTRAELVVSFHADWNDEGRDAIANLGESGVDPWTLVNFEKDADGRYSISTRSVTKVCKMRGQRYVVKFSPLMAPGFHPERLCASRMGAAVTVSLRGKVVASAGVDGCTEKGMVTKTFSVSPGREPSYEFADAWEFYNGAPRASAN